MSIRVHLVLALLAAALVPLAVAAGLGGPLLREAAARIDDRARTALRERLAAAAREPGRRLLERAWALRSAAAAEGDLALLASIPAGRRDRRTRAAARRRFLALARGARLGRGLLLRGGAGGRAAPVLAWPAGAAPDPAAGLPGPDRVAWIPVGRGLLGEQATLRLRAATRWPPAAGPASLLLVVEEALPAGELAGRLAERAGTAVRLVAGPPPAGDAVVVTFPGGSLRAVAAPPRPARELLARARGALAWTALAALLAALAPALVLGHLLAKPVRDLARAVDRVADAGSPVEPMPSGPGELGRLGARIERMVAALRDEHARRARAERLAAWRDAARRIAHEVRNPLTPIRLAVDNLERLAARDPRRLRESLPEETAAIREEVLRLERLVREFHEFARMPSPRPSPVDLPRLVGETLRARLGETGPPRWEVRVAGSVPAVRADADLLRTLVGNLAANAAAAGAGRLAVRIGPCAEPGRVELLFEDDGPGVPAELGERVFEPYVTGRGEGGTGLGLAICRRIAEDHGGKIEWLPSGTGARFRVELPVAGPGS